MTRQGVFDRNGERLGYVEGDRLYDVEGIQTGLLRDGVIYDLQETRRWLLDGHALTDLDGTVIGYLGDGVRDDDWTSD
ncbi:MAG: 4-fold beta flower protein [Chloroflexota bacterium]|nr:hypothetical protein [Anaerolineae bacterium]HMM29216.1 hypothetical protein [Aggregatilineaceae bacterium]